MALRARRPYMECAYLSRAHIYLKPAWERSLESPLPLGPFLSLVSFFLLSSFVPQDFLFGCNNPSCKHQCANEHLDLAFKCWLSIDDGPRTFPRYLLPFQCSCIYSKEPCIAHMYYTCKHWCLGSIRVHIDDQSFTQVEENNLQSLLAALIGTSSGRSHASITINVRV